MAYRQRVAAFLLAVLTAGLVIAVLLAPSRHTASALAAPNACKSNATGTFSDITVGLTGSGAPSPATVGVDTITLSGIQFTADVPATLLVSGYNLGLLTTGANSIPVKGWVAVAASNTVEGVKVLQFTTTVSTTITDPNGLPGTGDETATPLALNLALSSATFTPTGGTVSFSQGAPGSLPTIAAGQVGPGAVTPVGSIYISAQVAGGLIKANFDCQTGTSVTGGATFTPAAPGAFATVAVTGGGGTTVPGTTVPGTTTPATTAPGTTTPATTAPATTAPGTTAAPTTTVAGPSSGSGKYTTSCKNSVTPDLSELVFDATGTAPSEVQADSAFHLAGMKWRVTIPAGVFQTGINFGLLSPGTPVTGTLDLAIKGTKTAQDVQDATKINLTVPVTVNAQGQANPSTVEFTVPDMKWTALSGKIDFSMYGANVSVKIGLPNPVVFVCKPASAAPFLSITAVGSSSITTTTEVATEGPTTTVGQLVVTGPGDSLWVQGLAALALLDLGYLVLSLRAPRRMRRV